MNSASSHQPFRNRVLASLPLLEISRLEPHLRPVILEANQSLHDAGAVVHKVYFLEQGICSITVTMEAGRTVEVGMTGLDGFVGISTILGTRRSPCRSFMQIPGMGFSVDATTLLEQGTVSEKLRARLQQCVQGLLVQFAQIAACNCAHEVEERLARRLLMCYDRVRSDRLSITQEFLATALGSRRTSITLAAGRLQRAGLIEYSRGSMIIKDRNGLEDVACECYQVIREEYARLELL
jgi:CRP-like cAMP-binding protein